MKLPRNCHIEKGASILTVSKLLSFNSYKNELLGYIDSALLAGLTDEQLLKKLTYYLQFRALFLAGKHEQLKGYQYSRDRHLPHQLASSHAEPLLWDEVKNRPMLNSFLAKHTLFVELYVD